MATRTAYFGGSVSAGGSFLGSGSGLSSGTVPRASIVSGSADRVIINDGGGALDEVTQLSVPLGGTGVATLSGVVKGNTTSPFSAITGSAGGFAYWSDSTTISYVVGSSGEVLVSNGTSAPSFSTVSSIIGTILTTQGDTMIRDGSGVTRLAVGSSNNVLTVGAGSGLPEWGNSPLNIMTVAGDLLCTNGSAMTSITAVAKGAVFISDGAATAPKWTSTGTSGQVLTSQGAGQDAAWATNPVTVGTTVGDILYVSSIGPVTYSRLGVGTNGQVLQSNGTTPTWAGAGSLPTYSLTASDFENPNNSDWQVNSLAPAQPDPTNAGLTMRSFTYSTNNAVGFLRTIPSGATNMSMVFMGRVVSDVTGYTVGLNLAKRVIPNGASALSWVSGYAINIPVPTNSQRYYTYTESDTLANFGLTAGSLYQISINRQTPTVGSDYTSYYYLLNIHITFT